MSFPTKNTDHCCFDFQTSNKYNRQRYISHVIGNFPKKLFCFVFVLHNVYVYRVLSLLDFVKFKHRSLLMSDIWITK